MTSPRWLVATALAAAIASGCTGASQQGQRPSQRPTIALGDVIVPGRAAHTDLIDAYDILHRLGLRVELTKQIGISSLAVPGVVLTPRAGAKVPQGSTVKIAPGFGPIGSPAVSTSHPHYRVPDFDGQLLSVAIAWASQHDMFWAVPALPALPATNAPHLFDAYRIDGQTPRAGQTIVQGVANGHNFRVTPLTLRVVLG
jgi:hypothetical protein